MFVFRFATVAVFSLALMTAGNSSMSQAEELPADAADLLAAFEEDAEALRFEAERKIQKEKLALIKQLQALQDKYTRAAKLDEAVAIRDRIRALKADMLSAKPGPTNMSAFTNQVGKRFYFKVTGTTQGSVYGTNFYTTDSSLAAVAVHSGALKNGETGIVRVIMFPARNNFLSSTKNGITSSQWNSYPGSYKVERIYEIPVKAERKIPENPAPPEPVRDPFGPEDPEKVDSE